MERNYNVYLAGMEKSKSDKLFFLDYIDINSYDVIIDFGCGQGEIIRVCAEATNKPVCYGIDKDGFMRHVAGVNCSHVRCIFEESLENLPIKDDKDILLIFSSVLHEVEGYWETLEKFILSHSGHITVVIRDMYFDNLKNEKIGNHEHAMIIKNSNLRMLGEFVEKYGLTTKKDMYHYLLKYSYIDNWDLELQENYFSFDWDRLTSKGKAIMDLKYTLPFKKERVKYDFGVDLDLPTHRKLIIKI